MASSPTRRRIEHLFFSGVALLLGAYVLLGFWHSYVGAGLVLAPLPSLLVHIHAVLFVGWIALLIAQAALVSTGNVGLHRRMGKIMAGWAVALVLIGPATAIMAARRPGSGVGAAPLAGDFMATIAFAILIRAGFLQRRDAPAHKRLMTLASVAIIGPAIVRWPFGFIQNGPPIGVSFVYLLPPLLLVAYDLATRRRAHRAIWLGLGLIAAILVSFVAIPALPAWQAFTRWVQHA